MAYQILIVDDDSEFRQEMRECLFDYQVIEAANGFEALSILKKPNAIDLVVLDVMMPNMSGLDVLRQIKTLKPALSIIILTGKSSKDIAIEALKAHADDYIEKPFDVNQFLETVRTILSSKTLRSFKNPHGVEAKIKLAQAFIERNFDKKITLEDVANQICLSPKYFSRIFKEKTGQGFNEYRLKIKIKEASKLLIQTDFSISELSNKFGYENLESFVRVFKRIKGLTPKEYRDKYA